MRDPATFVKLSFCCAALSTAAFCQGSSAILGIGYLYPPVTVAPGQLVTVFLDGNIQGNITAAVGSHTAPVLQVRTPSAAAGLSLTAVTIQIPYEIEPACFFTDPACQVVTAAPLVVSVNGAPGAPLSLSPVPDRVHILSSCDTVVSTGSGSAPDNGLPCSPLVTHANGSMVSQASPAQGEEVLVAYAVGLGLTNPAVATGQAATTATPTYETFDLDFNFRPNALATKPLVLIPSDYYFPQYSGLVPGYVGLYQINFAIPPPPAGLVPCSGTVQSNLTVSFGGLTSFDGAGICVTP